MKRALLAAAVPLAILLGGLFARALLAHAPARFATDLAQPLPVVTAWGGFGAELFAVFALSLAVAALAAFGFALELSWGELQSRDLRLIWTSAAATLAAALAWPAVFSSDAYAYAAYGELALHGIDPYVRLASNVHGPFVDLARWQWSGTFPPCVYGTGFVEVARGLVALFGAHDPAQTLLAFRVLTSLAWLATAYVFWLIARRWFPARQGGALALFALNPLGLWCAAEGHNDALMVLAVLLGALAAVRGAFFAGGLTLGLAALLKAAALPAGPLLALYLAPRAGRRHAVELVGGYLAGVAASALLLAGPMWHALAVLGAHGAYAPEVSLQSLTGALPAFALAAVAALAGLRALLRGEGSGLLWLAISVPLALPNPYPWYMMWVLPVAAAARGPAAAWLWIATIAGSLRYLPDALGPLRSDTNMLAATVALVPLAVAAALLVRPALTRREARVAS